MARRPALDSPATRVQHFPPTAEVRPLTLADLAPSLLAGPRRDPEACAVEKYRRTLTPADAATYVTLLDAGVSATALTSALGSPAFLASYGGVTPYPVPHDTTIRKHVHGRCCCPVGTPGRGVQK